MSEIEDFSRKTHKVASTTTALAQRPESRTVPERGEWFRWFRNASLVGKLAYVSMPFITYASYQIWRGLVEDTNFVVQKTHIFRQSIQLISKSKQVKEVFGNQIEIGDLVLYSFTSGLYPWLEKKHFWVRLKGPLGNGWARIDLKIRDEKYDKKTVKEYFTDWKIVKKWDQLTGQAPVTGIIAGAPIAASTVAESTVVPIVEPAVVPVVESVVESTTVETAVVESTVKSTSESASESTAEARAESSGESSVVSAVKSLAAESAVVSSVVSAVESAVEPEQKTAKQLALESAAIGEFIPGYGMKLPTDRSEVCKLFPGLPEDYSKQELNTAIAIAGKLQQSKAMDRVWWVRGVSVHPDNKDPIILYNSEGELDQEYFSEAIYENNLFKIKKPMWYKELQLKKQKESQENSESK